MTGDTEGLARKASCKYVRNSLILVNCTGLDETVNVSKDWCFVEESVFDPLREDFLAVGVVFDIAYRPPAQQLSPKQTTTGT
tara:strand:+ start:556 stop:801 length:246 start_codon:yes stop_codon:yes gene_type:complete